MVWCLLTASFATAEDASAIRVAVYDYAGVPPQQLAESQAHVSRLFDAIGVEILWSTISPRRRLPERGKPLGSQLTIVVLSSAMARRMIVAGDVMGLAPASVESPGSLAYVFYDRVADLARANAAPATDFLGLVIAHEMGHLLLPVGSHSAEGLMRGRWHAAELRRQQPERLQFTREQAEQIRGRLRGAGDAP